jgi:hypothetical protein
MITSSARASRKTGSRAGRKGGETNYRQPRACGAPQPCCCASRIAVALLERRPSRRIVLEASSKKECLSMRIHIDKNQFDGNAIALVVIGLLIVIALAY